MTFILTSHLSLTTPFMICDYFMQHSFLLMFHNPSIHIEIKSQDKHYFKQIWHLTSKIDLWPLSLTTLFEVWKLWRNLCVSLCLIKVNICAQ